MYGHFLPYLSLRIPKIMAPTLRVINVNVIPHVISEFAFPKVSARFSTVRETVKKSKASQVHPSQPTRKKSHCWPFNSRRTLNGFATYVPRISRLV